MARPALVLVPTEVTWAYTATAGWHTIPTPPAWWFDMAEDPDPPVHGPLRLVPPLPLTAVRVTACRPGWGPCKRQHEHRTARRTT